MTFLEIREKLNIEYGCSIAKRLSRIGNDGSSIGFRNAGSTGERKAAEFIKNEMCRIGLQDVCFAPFHVDAWEFKGASISLGCNDGKRIAYPLSAFAGTPGGMITAKVVDAGNGTFKECQALELEGAIAFIRIDLSKEYWVGVPAYQLARRGARAVIVVFEGNQFGTDPKALNSADCISRPEIPILNISREHGKELASLLKQSERIGHLTVEICLDREGGESRNIVGMIPGIHEKEYIVLGGHYDGYFYAYQDDAFGIGIIMMIARAIMESGYKPQHTIVIIAHGAEEFGICDSHYDWCIGSWNQICNIRPDWVKRTRLFLNIDAVAPDATEYIAQASPEIYHFLNSCFREIGVEIEEQWPKGYRIEDVNGPWSDDYSYHMEGIPVVICGRGPSQWRSRHYHTQFDDYKLENVSLFQKIARIYLHILLKYDAYLFFPLNFEPLICQFEESIDLEVVSKYGINSANLRGIIQLAEKNARNICTPGEWINRKKVLLIEKDSVAGYNDFLHEVNHILLEGLRGLGSDDAVIYKHEAPQQNLKILENIERCLKKRQRARARKQLEQLSGSSVVADFEYEVYQYWCLDAMNLKLRNLQWGTGRVQPAIDISKLHHAILDEGEGYEKLLRIVKELKQFEIEKLKQAIEEEADSLKKMICMCEQKIKKQRE